ncbi:MAG: AAA family ATPase, partial [Candidatus Baltobacteraceae bacterium]
MDAARVYSVNGDIFDRLALVARPAIVEDGNSARIVHLVPASSIAPVETRFILAPYIPRGEATWIEGVTKSGKTMALCDIIARITRGDSFPTGTAIALGRCAILTCED